MNFKFQLLASSWQQKYIFECNIANSYTQITAFFQLCFNIRFVFRTIHHFRENNPEFWYPNRYLFFQTLQQGLQKHPSKLVWLFVVAAKNSSFILLRSYLLAKSLSLTLHDKQSNNQKINFRVEKRKSEMEDYYKTIEAEINFSQVNKSE